MFESISSIFSNKKLVVILFVSIIFIGVATYIYYAYVSPRLYPKYVSNKEYIQQEGELTEPEIAEIYLFYTSWCPHCTKSKPIWTKFREDYEGHVVGNAKLVFREVDCDEDKETASEFEIEGYPTVKMVYRSKVIEYDAKIKYDTLEEFVREMIQNN